MYIQPEYNQINILLDKLIKSKISNYHKDRNYVYFEKERFKNVSGLSTFISRGLLKEKTLLKKIIISQHKNDKFIQEIFWRVYWQGWLENHSKVWESYKNNISNIESKNLYNIANYQEAINGSTSIKPFNEWVKLLKQDGYLHNHERMWFASIWIHYLEIPWQLGCKFFYEHLFDGDVASNLLSWRWVAGLQTLGKKYIATESNINKYTNNRYLGLKLPKIKNIIIENEDRSLNSIVKSSLQETYEDCAFMFMDNNLNLDLFNRLQSKNKILILIRYNLTSIKKSKNVLNFQKKLFKDFVKLNIKEKIKYYEFEIPNENYKLKLFLKSKGIKNIIFDYCRIGYERDLLNNFILKIDDRITVHNILDDFYNQSWQYCKKGFFQFRERIPMLLKVFS